MKESKPDWYTRLKTGPFEQEIFDSKMQQMVDQRARRGEAKLGKRRVNAWALAGVTVLLLACVIAIFPSLRGELFKTQAAAPAEPDPSVMTAEYVQEHLKIGLGEYDVTLAFGEPTEQLMASRNFPSPHVQELNDLNTWSQLSVSRYDYDIRKGYKVHTDGMHPDVFDEEGLKHGKVASQLIIVWNNEIGGVERAIYKYGTVGSGIMTVQIGPAVEAEPPRIRATGKSALGTFELLPVPLADEKIEWLDTSGCGGQKNDLSFKGHYEMFFTDQIGRKMTLAEWGHLELVQKENEPAKLIKYDFSNFELFLFYPRYVGCENLEFYAYGIDRKTGQAWPYGFVDNNETMAVWKSPPHQPPTVTDTHLVVDGPKEAGSNGAMRYHFKPDVAKHLLVLEGTEPMP